LGRLNTKKTILDAGCGAGISSKLLALHIPKDATVYSFDFSNEMLKYCQKEFAEFNDFNANKNNHWEYVDIDANSKIDVEEDIKELRAQKSGKIFKFFNSSIENIPFKDEQFEAVVSNLCIMLAQDHNKASKEIFRVLQPGGVAVLSVWGKKEKTQLSFKIFDEIFAQIKEFQNIKEARSSYHLGEDPEIIKKAFYDAGFKEVITQYTDQIYDCFSVQDYLIRFQGPKINFMLDQVKDPELVARFAEEVEKQVVKQMIETKLIPTLSCMLIVAFK
jgi:ubiquinone/menaquinone biosynthesis C-methylase UbiE